MAPVNGDGEDPLAPSRGCIYGVLLALAFLALLLSPIWLGEWL